MLESSLERIKKDIMELARFNATPGKGCTRFSYSSEDKKARAYLLQRFLELGLKVSVDAVGNIRARREGSVLGAPIVMTGSHMDTVFNGGRFDGVAGVVCALEAVRVICENEIKTKNPVEIIIFAEEEGSNFGSTMAGSKALTGRYGISELKKLKSDNGRSMYDLAKDFGFEPDKLPDYIIKPGEIKAMIELHIEQSVVLDTENVPIGIVEAIFGSKCLRVVFKGVPNHAGATPMHLRKDPMAAAAGVIAKLPEIVKQKAFPTTVATVGKIYCIPNIINCIPEKVAFTIDIRDVNPSGIEIIIKEVERLINKMADLYCVEAAFEQLAESEVIKLSAKVIDAIEKAAKEQGILYKKMNSGAVHDSAMLANFTEVGMIFVPSIGGRSHVPEEFTDIQDIKQGCDLLLKTIIALSN